MSRAKVNNLRGKELSDVTTRHVRHGLLIELMAARLNIGINQGEIITCNEGNYVYDTGMFLYCPRDFSIYHLGRALPLCCEVTGLDDKPFNYYTQVSNFVWFDQRPYLNELLSNLTVEAQDGLHYINTHFMLSGKTWHIRSNLACRLDNLNSCRNRFISQISEHKNSYITTALYKNTLSLCDDVTVDDFSPEDIRDQYYKDRCRELKSVQKADTALSAEIAYHKEFLSNVSKILSIYLIPDIANNIIEYLTII